MGNCRSLWIVLATNLLVQGSHIDSVENNANSGQVGPVYLDSNTTSSILNNLFTYTYGRAHMNDNTNIVVDGNTIIRNATGNDLQNGTAPESGGIEGSFDSNLQLVGNTIETLNDPPEIDDGESFTSQHSNTRDILDAGTITSMTSSTLTDAGALWDTTTTSEFATYPGTVAVMYTGAAAGEVRAVQSISTSTKTLVLSQPWNPLPSIGDAYALFRWSLQNATIANNTISGGMGIALWDGCYDCTIQNNTLSNTTEAILDRTVDQIMSPGNIYYTYEPESRRVHQMSENVNILDNTITNTTGLEPSYVMLDEETAATDTYQGLGQMNMEIGGNNISPWSGNPSYNYGGQRGYEGFFPCYAWGPTSAVTPASTIFQNVHYWGDSLSSPISYPSGFQAAATTTCITASAPTGYPAPAISNVGVSAVGTSTATIAWTTDQGADSTVAYGTDTSYGSSATNAAAFPTFATAHTVALSGLSSSATYHFQAQSSDGTPATSSDATFTTLSVPSVAVGPAVYSGGGASPSPDFTISNGALITANPTVELEMHVANDIHTMQFATSSGSAASYGVQIPYSSIFRMSLCGQASSCAPGSYTIFATFFTSPSGPSYKAQHSIVLAGAVSTSTLPSPTGTPPIIVPPAQPLKVQPIQPSSSSLSFASSSAFTRNLTLGSRGSEVVALQKFLIGRNSGPRARKLASSRASGYFGPLTKAALAEFQAKVGIVPASGYFGPATRAWINAHE